MRDTTVAPAPNSPANSGVLQTNAQNSTGFGPFVNGDYYLIPQGLCDYRIVSTQLVTLVPVTNTIVVGTNNFGATNVNGQFFARQTITYLTNFTFVVDPIVCPTNGVTGATYHQGIEKMTFVRRSFDSLLGQFYEPMTNRFHLNQVTNNLATVQTFERVTIQPDILFSADDLEPPPDTPAPILGLETVIRNIRYNTNNALPGLPGPGLIEPNLAIVFNKVGPSFLNEGPFFMDEPVNFSFFVWGSFDGSTNAPVVYPSNTSLVDYENGILMQVVTASLPAGRVGTSYLAVLEGSGGEEPYSWSLAPGSEPLPPGLGQFSPDCSCWVVPEDGLIRGTPTTAGTYPFTVRLTDAGVRSVTREFSITISAP
jgi:hypothetical protein